MVIDAVRGSPTTAPSRTAHFRAKGHARTPARSDHSRSSSTETDSDNDNPTDPEVSQAVKKLGILLLMEKLIVPLKWHSYQNLSSGLLSPGPPCPRSKRENEDSHRQACQ